MKDGISVQHSITIEEAINLVSGTRKYQKLLIIILSLSFMTINPMMKFFKFFLIDKNCKPSESCEGSNYYDSSATAALGISNEISEIRELFYHSNTAGKLKAVCFRG